jgi:hypothetical protein
LQKIKHERQGGAPREDWVTKNREILLMQVRNTMNREQTPSFLERVRHFFSIFVPSETLVMAARALGIFVLVSGTVVAGGLASAQVYHEAIPGEFFYNVKLSMEKMQLTLAPNDSYKATLYTAFADRRMDEVAKLAEASTSRQERIPAVLADFEKNIIALEASLDAMRQHDPSGVAEVAKLTERKMAVYQNVLRKAGTSVVPSAAAAIAHGKDIVDDVTIKAMAIIVEKHLGGDEHASRSVVVTKFEDQLDQAEANLDSVSRRAGEQETTKKAKAVIAEAKKFLKDEDYQAALSKIVEVVELTKEAEVIVKDEEKKDEEKKEAEAGEAAATTKEEEPTPGSTQSSANETAVDGVGSGSR